MSEGREGGREGGRKCKGENWKERGREGGREGGREATYLHEFGLSDCAGKAVQDPAVPLTVVGRDTLLDQGDLREGGREGGREEEVEI